MDTRRKEIEIFVYKYTLITKQEGNRHDDYNPCLCNWSRWVSITTFSPYPLRLPFALSKQLRCRASDLVVTEASIPEGSGPSAILPGWGSCRFPLTLSTGRGDTETPHGGLRDPDSLVLTSRVDADTAQIPLEVRTGPPFSAS